jgi:flagellar hook protein FlgE
MGTSAFYTALSGLNAQSRGLDTIGNNLANSNTIGFKASSTRFEDILSQTYGAGPNTNPVQIGLGVQLASVSGDFSQGSIQTTSRVTDLAIQGKGFFLVQPPNATGQFYTRAGSFGFDAQGYLVDQSGLRVLGYSQRDQAGAIDPASPLAPIQIAANVTAPPAATAKFQIGMNLQGDATTGQQFVTTFDVVDSMGSQHTVTATFTKTANAREWSYQLTVPGDEVQGGTPGTPFVIAGGGATDVLRFNYDAQGNLVLATPAADIAIPAVAGWTNGASGSAITWQLRDAAGVSSITGYSAPSALQNFSQNGRTAGDLVNISVDDSGTVIGLFSNGTTQTLAQLALADFNNPNGLLRVGGNLLAATGAAGTPTIGVPGAGGRGTISPSSLELSNVSIADEFTNMIVTERAYQANSKVITTSDELLQEALSLKR